MARAELSAAWHAGMCKLSRQDDRRDSAPCIKHRADQLPARAHASSHHTRRPRDRGASLAADWYEQRQPVAEIERCAMLTSHTYGDLLHQLKRQYPIGVSTWSHCAAGCGQSARGGGHCSACLSQELKDRGLSGWRLIELHQALRNYQQAQLNLNAAFEAAHKELGTK